MGQAAEFVPLSAKYAGAFLLLAISIKPMAVWIRSKFNKADVHDRTSLKEDGKQEPVTDPPVCAGST